MRREQKDLQGISCDILLFQSHVGKVMLGANMDSVGLGNEERFVVSAVLGEAWRNEVLHIVIATTTCLG